MKAALFRIPIGTPGTLAITPRPRGGDWLDDDIAALVAQGVSVLISLLHEVERDELGLTHEASTCAARGVEFIGLPVPDLGVPADGRAFILAVHGLVAKLRAGRNIAVHCRQSVGRSGLLAVSVAVAAGVGLESAIKDISIVRGVPVPETPAQREWLRRNARDLRGLAG